VRHQRRQFRYYPDCLSYLSRRDCLQHRHYRQFPPRRCYRGCPHYQQCRDCLRRLRYLFHLGQTN
jgi:hypothetical protein